MSAENTPDTDSSRKVMVVDDSFLIRRLQKELLEKLGLGVCECSNGQEALEKLGQLGPENISFIVLDLLMPLMNGVEFIMKARETYGEKLPPLMICSSKSDLNIIKQLATIGIKGYIVKPIDPAQYIKKIKDIVPGLP